MSTIDPNLSDEQLEILRLEGDLDIVNINPDSDELYDDPVEEMDDDEQFSLQANRDLYYTY